MNPLRSVGARLSLALILVVAGALTLVYLVVIPSLQSRLVNGKISQLERTAPTLRQQILKNLGDPFFLEDAGAAANVRIVVFRLFSVAPPSLIPTGDSHGGTSSADVQDDPIALSSALAQEKRHGTVSRDGDRFAEVAVPFPGNQVLLLSASLHDALDSVGLARQRLLLAGGIVLVLALVVGYFGAWLFARRIRRLERAAERIASGHFDEPIVDLGADEVGEVARAFERMRQRLSQLDRARREFIANASHELRTPLFSLGGFLELLDSEELEPETRREFLATMRVQVTRLTKLAAELLDLSRLDAGQIEVGREPIPLAEMARLVAEEFAAVAKKSRHGLKVEADDDAFALGDAQRVVQIARILVENALVHTPAGTNVRVLAARGRAAVSLAVEDDGPGVSPEQAAHVFERFYRGDSTQASGSGLGLAIGLELARVMGGTLELESEQGRTCFRLTLPAADTAGDEASRPLERVGA